MTTDLTVFERLLRAVRQSQSAGDPSAFLETRDTLVAELVTRDSTLDLLRAHPPTEALRRLAAQLDGEGDMPGAAWACITVAMQLEPGSVAVHKTRGMVGMSTLKPEAAKASFARAEAAGDPHAGRLGEYCRMIYPAATFASVRYPEGPAPGRGDQAPSSIGRSLEEVRHQIQVYATRLQSARKRMRKNRDDRPASWLVPNLGHLLPDGLVPLSPEERPDVVRLLGTQHQARGDWAALTWMCWLVGLDQAAFPDALEPRAEVANCVAWAEFGLWRTRDQQLSRGAGASEAGLQGLTWRGQEVGDMAKPVAKTCALDAARLLGMARWLTDASVKSPFETEAGGDR